MLQRDLRQISVELFGQNHRNRGVDALAHLDLGHHQRGLAGGVDADEGIGGEFALGHIRRLHRLVAGAQRKVEREQETGGETAGQQRAA